MGRVLTLLAAVSLFAACAPRVARLPPSLSPSAQLNAASLGRVWVAGFATMAHAGVDVNAETVRLVRAELRHLSPAFIVDGAPITVDSEQRLSDVPFWRTLGEEHGASLIVTGTVRLRFAPPAIVERGPRATYLPTAGRDLDATVVLIDGRTGVALSSQRLPSRRRYGVGRFSSGLSLFLQLMDRAMPDWLGAIASAPPPQRRRDSLQKK
jgi:hypothetical protein